MAELPLTATTYRNPVVAADCPDPTSLRHDGEWWTMTTSGSREPSFPIRASADLVTWREVGALFATGQRPLWIASDCWAPELARLDDGSFACWYTARDRVGRLCVGLARAAHPAGPWRDRGAPLIRTAHVGEIDPAFLRCADGSTWLYWKQDGNDLRPAQPTVMHGSRLAPDGETLIGDRVEVLRNDLPWEGDVVEGPGLIERDGWFWLFYAANAFGDARYATGVARARHPLGPFEKRREPILRSNERWRGPGHGVPVRVGDAWWFLYHAWGAGEERQRGRQLLLDPIAWGADGWPTIGAGTPSIAARPRPALAPVAR